MSLKIVLQNVSADTNFVPHKLSLCINSTNLQSTKYIRNSLNCRFTLNSKLSENIVPDLRNLNYLSRLAKIGIPTLESRSKRIDAIQLFKIVSKQSTVHLHAFADSSQTPKINHSSMNLRKKPRLRKQLCLSKPRENFFTNRVASLWNELPDTLFDKFRSQQLAANDTSIVYFLVKKKKKFKNKPFNI
ncbi:RNA-directed DNA polymerase from mobile element jockey-like [Brachionus plicatilis]|uniref:RNA-directed DNA polymerase from mobile element jockey-like n=1 Tax=Brachionus plicatilis TaxID=10195 RepID=A0A3M7SCU2_BRAPC|nr:RNA-directed DNA polymerase from mobile element jockey-like [Brachionus plicatilis]